MADVNANIHIGIDATQALGQLRALQSQISSFNRSVAAGNAAAAATQASMANSLASMVGATGQFNTSIRTMESGISSLGTAFDKGTLSSRQYFRYAASQMPGLTRAFRGLGQEQAQMADLATDRVKRLQTQYVSLGKDVRGMQKVMAITPKNLAAGYATDLAVAQQRQQLFNRSLELGSTGLVNWGKNTQWAGRQLMVGFTVPLTIAAGAAAKFFMELDKASMQFRRVYGDMNTSTEETYRNLEAIRALGVEYTKYGTAVKDVIDIGARVAATGAQNQDLIAGTEETLRLATLGQMEYGNALQAVTSLQTAFSINAEDLGNKINFLNAVENQTVLTMEDMAAAIPRVAPVIKGLGGDVEDLAVFMTALREGGVTAEQGANALKSGLASLINPTTRAQESLMGLGININEIVQTNKGDLMGTVKAFGDALNSLSEFERQQALETVFGKYQYARLGALFKNISNDASQSARAMELAGTSIEELRGMAEKELAIVSETVTSQFLGAVERLKVAIAPIGEMFLKVVTPVINAVTAIADAFNQLPDGVKTAIGAVVAMVGGIAPVFLMGIGLIGNAIGNGLKTILALRNGVKGLAASLTGSAANFKYQSGAAIDSAAAMASLEGRVSSLTSDLLIQEGAVTSLIAAYRGLASAASSAAASMPRGFAMPGMPGMARPGGMIPPIKLAGGGLVPGTGNKDTVPAMLTPGESVVTKQATAKYGPVIAAMNAGNLPGFNGGMVGASGSYLTGAGKFVSPFAMMMPRAGNQSAFGVDAGIFSSDIGRAIFASMTKDAIDFADRMETGARYSAKTVAQMGALDPLLDSLHEKISGQLESATSIDDAMRLAKPEMDKIVDDYIQLGTQTGQLTKEQGAAIRTGYGLAISDPQAAERAGLVRAERIDVREGQYHATRTQHQQMPGAKASPLSAFRRLPQSAILEMQRRGLQVPDWLRSGAERAHLQSVGQMPFTPGMIPSRVQGAGLSPQQSAEVQRIALMTGQRAAQSTAVGAGTKSPSTITRQVGQDIGRGLIVGMESLEGQVRAAGQSVGAAGVQGAKTAAITNLDDMAAALKQRQAMFGDEFGPPQGPTSPYLGPGGQPEQPRRGFMSRMRAGARGAAVGGGMGLGMASMIPMMMQDQQGKFLGMDANIASMGGMAGGTLLSMIGMVPGPLLAVAGAATAAGIAIAAWRQSVDESSRAAAEFGANIGGTANALVNVANMLGKATPTQQLTQLQLGVTQEEQELAFGEFQSMMNTEAGQAFIQKLESATSADRFTMLGDHISAAIASGLMDTRTGQAFAKTIAASMNDPVLGNAVSRAIAQQETGAKAMIDLAEKRLSAVQETAGIQALQGRSAGPLGGLGAGRAGALMGFEQASQVIGSSIQVIRDFAEAAAMAELEYKNGTITFAEYQDVLRQSSAVQEQYGDYIRKSMQLTTDRGGTMQAVKSQLMAMGITEEQFGAVEAAAGEVPGREELLEAGVVASEAVKASGYRLSDAVSALAEGMNPADVAAIMNFTSDLSTAAGQFYAQNMGEQGAIQTAGFVMAAETGQIAGAETEQERQRVIDVGVNFTGNVADLQAFLTAIPEEKVMTVVTKLEAINPQQQQAYISSVQKLSSMVGQEAAMAITESPEFQAALEKARGEALSTKGTRRGPSSQKDLKEIEDAVQNAADAGVFSDLESVITFVLNEDPSDLTERLPELTGYAEDLNENVPPEILKMLKIDIENPEDLDKYGPMAEDLGKLVPILEKVPDVAKTMAVGLMFRKNGKVSTVDEYAKDANKLIKFSKNLESSDLEVKKTTIVQMLQEFAGPGGEQISEDQALNMFDELVSRYGEQKIMNLPPDSIFQLIQLRSQITGVRESIALLEKVQQLGPEEARALEERRQKLAELLSFESNVVVTGGVGTSSGTGSGSGGSSGGGEGQKDPFQVMMDDLKLQKKLLGDVIKGQDGLKSGFAQALRNAGAPEYLIAEIISKGADGIKIAKKLLQDKQKKLKELMDLSLEVTRMTFIESQRAAANNFRAQSTAQNALFGAGIDPAAAMDIASDPQQAEMIAASYERIQKAQAALASAKGEKDKKRARKELADAKKDWDQLTGSIQNATKAQQQFNIDAARGQVKVQRKAINTQGAALTRLMVGGFTFQQAQEFAGDEMIAGAIVSAGRAADAAARRVAYLTKQLEGAKRGSKEYKRLNRELKEAEEQADKTSKKYKALIADLNSLTKVQKENLVTNTIAEYKGLTGELGMQQNILQQLINSGMSYAQAIEIASDPQKALAFAAALEQGEDVLAQMVAEAQALEAATAKFSLAIKLAEFGDAKKKQGFLGAVTALTSGNPLGGMVTDYLMGLSTSELQEFFNQTPEWRQNFVNAFLDSIPLAEKIKSLFDQISAEQKYQSLLNRDKANKDKGNIDALDDQLKAQRKLLEAEQDKLKVHQKTIDVIQEENDDYNRGLELLSRQEEKINEAFDKRLEALDKVEQANARIAQQQQNQLNLAQALSTGDIYAATQAAQQIKQDNATAAIENTRDALEQSREEQIKNLVVEVNGLLLTREQIEKRIEANNDRIYQIQENQIEPIQAVIDGIQNQIDSIETLKDTWQEYYDSLEKNAVDPLTGMKYSELEKIKAYYDALIARGMEAGAAFNQAMADYVAGGGKITDEARLRGFFGISATPAATTAEDEQEADAAAQSGGATTKDVNAANEAAIKALPSVTAVLNVAKQIWPEIAKWEDNILSFAGAVKDTLNPLVATTRNMIAKIGSHLVETINPELTPIRNKWERIAGFANDSLVKITEMAALLPGLGTLIQDNLITSFNNVVNKIVEAVGKVAALIRELNAIPRNITVTITIETVQGGDGGSSDNNNSSPTPEPPKPPKPPKPKKFTGGLIKMATGGMIPGGIPRDSVPILASPGEFVVRNAMVDKYGMSMLNDINQGSFQPRFRAPSGTSYTKINKPTEINTDRTMYNNSYNISVTANTNANADEIASATVMKIRQMNSMQIRGARG